MLHATAGWSNGDRRKVSARGGHRAADTGANNQVAGVAGENGAAVQRCAGSGISTAGVERSYGVKSAVLENAYIGSDRGHTERYRDRVAAGGGGNDVLGI